MWLYFNIVPYGTGVTMPHEGHNDPTEAQVRWQIATALGYGATGLLYFEWHPMGDGHPGLVMSVNGTAVPSPHYFQVRAEKTKRHRMNRFSDDNRSFAKTGSERANGMLNQSVFLLGETPQHVGARTRPDTPARGKDGNGGPALRTRRGAGSAAAARWAACRW